MVWNSYLHFAHLRLRDLMGCPFQTAMAIVRCLNSVLCFSACSGIRESVTPVLELQMGHSIYLLYRKGSLSQAVVRAIFP